MLTGCLIPWKTSLLRAQSKRTGIWRANNTWENDAANKWKTLLEKQVPKVALKWAEWLSRSHWATVSYLSHLIPVWILEINEFSRHLLNEPGTCGYVTFAGHRHTHTHELSHPGLLTGTARERAILLQSVISCLPDGFQHPVIIFFNQKILR